MAPECLMLLLNSRMGRPLRSEKILGRPPSAATTCPPGAAHSAESGVVIATAESIDTEEVVKILYSGNTVYNNWNLLEFCSNDFVDSEADAKKRFAAGKAEACKARQEESHDCFDEDVFAGMSETRAAHYQRLAKKLAFDVAERDNKERPTCPEIWQNPYYSVWKSNFGRPMPSMRLVDFHKGTTGSTSRTARATPAPAACGSSAVGRAVGAGMSWSSTGRAARTTAS